MNAEEASVKWKRDMKNKGYAECPYPHCRIGFLSICGVKKHFKMCMKVAQEGSYVSCFHCNARFVRYSCVRQHMQKLHPSIVEDTIRFEKIKATMSFKNKDKPSDIIKSSVASLHQSERILEESYQLSDSYSRIGYIPRYMHRDKSFSSYLSEKKLNLKDIEISDHALLSESFGSQLEKKFMLTTSFRTELTKELKKKVDSLLLLIKEECKLDGENYLSELIKIPKKQHSVNASNSDNHARHSSQDSFETRQKDIINQQLKLVILEAKIVRLEEVADKAKQVALSEKKALYENEVLSEKEVRLLLWEQELQKRALLVLKKLSETIDILDGEDENIDLKSVKESTSNKRKANDKSCRTVNTIVKGEPKRQKNKNYESSSVSSKFEKNDFSVSESKLSLLPISIHEPTSCKERSNLIADKCLKSTSSNSLFTSSTYKTLNQSDNCISQFFIKNELVSNDTIQIDHSSLAQSEVYEKTTSTDLPIAVNSKKIFLSKVEKETESSPSLLRESKIKKYQNRRSKGTPQESARIDVDLGQFSSEDDVVADYTSQILAKVSKLNEAETDEPVSKVCRKLHDFTESFEDEEPAQNYGNVKNNVEFIVADVDVSLSNSPISLGIEEESNSNFAISDN